MSQEEVQDLLMRLAQLRHERDDIDSEIQVISDRLGKLMPPKKRKFTPNNATGIWAGRPTA